jgi:DNA-binding MarR family transcriptional regulator
MNALETMNLARKHGISSACLHPLLALIEDSPLIPSVVAERIGCAPANVTGHIDTLARQGWVHLRLAPNDRRKKLLTPSLRAFEIFAPAITE